MTQAPGTAAPRPNGLLANRDNISGLLTTAGLVVIVSMLLRSNRKRMRERSEQLVTMPLPQKSGNAVLDRLDTMMANANELSRTLAGSIDSRAVRLEILLAEADQRIETLTAALRSQEQQAVSPGGPIDATSHPAR